MRAFAFLSLAAAALAMPVAVPAGSLANVLAPVAAPVAVVAPILAKVGVDANAAIANANVAYNDVADGSLDNNDINVARGINVEHVGVDAKNPNVNVLSGVHHQRSVANVYAPLYVILKAIADLCAQVGVDVDATIANIGFNYNTILNNSLNGNDISILSRAAANLLVQIVASIVALVNALVKAGVATNVIIANVTAAGNSIANNSVNGNAVSVASRSLVNAVAPVTAVLTAIIPILVRVCADINAEVLNLALNYNSIANDIVNGNNIHIL